MNLRKFFNIPNKEQEQLIQDGIVKLTSIADKISIERNNKDYESTNRLNSICPNCNSTTVVNKISRVQGSGNISGSFSLFGGGLYGSGSIDTNEVNHCNSCGNEWKKYKWNITTTNELIYNWLNHINDYYKTNDEWLRKHYKETIQILKDIPAESLYIWFDEHSYSSSLYYSTKENLSLKIIRKYFKSVYDNK